MKDNTTRKTPLLSGPDLIAKARTYAIQAHSRINHRRKYSLEPYDVHLKDVADILSSATDDAEMIAAAWLHDVVEDTPATFFEIEQQFGPEVAQLVAEVTDISTSAHGNRATRKAIDRAHLSNASWRGKTIKLADLIDNCRDICSHDPEFAKVYLTEMSGLLEVLSDGQPDLYNRAVRLLHRSAESLSLPLEVITSYQAISKDDRSVSVFRHDRASDMFLKAFAAKDIARTLPSVDSPLSSSVHTIMEQNGMPALGVRHDGYIRAYIMKDEPLQERTFRPDQLVDEKASFSEVIIALTRHEICFVRVFDSVTGIITRDDIEHPFIRMWLFGIITMMEMQTVDFIEKRWPDEAWVQFLSEKRLEKARELLNERLRRNQSGSLLNCLQFSDKFQILIEDQKVLQDLGFPSKRIAKRVCKDLESLRNNLSHAQDIVGHDFAQIARMARRIESGNY